MFKTKHLFLFAFFVVSIASLSAFSQPFRIHIQGDSNSEGMLPGPDCNWDDEICAGMNTDRPWPAVMDESLREQGVQVDTINHAEAGRQLVGRSSHPHAHNGVGQKDGRVALQQIVMDMMNHGGERNGHNVLVLNLGTNDLQVEGITVNQLRGRMITHLTTILTNPQLQLRLLATVAAHRRDQAKAFLVALNRLTANEIRMGETTTELADLILGNRDLIRELFDLIQWQIIVVPPVNVTGRPFGQFPAAELSNEWANIVREVVHFFATPRMRAATDAQIWARPHVEEFGGFVHLNPTDHETFGLRMAEFMIGTQIFRQEPQPVPGLFEGARAFAVGAQNSILY